jgi:dynein light intermediate chain
MAGDPGLREPEATLIHFGIPQLVTGDRGLDKIGKKFKELKGFLTNDDRGGLKQKRKNEGRRVESKPCSTATLSNSDQDILNLISPPREWFQNHKHWRQMVSSVPSTRIDVLDLKKKMEGLLKNKVAHKTGLCEIRRAIYSQVFDELIRHVTVNCAERGLMLIHVRDDLRHLLTYIERIYTSAVAYGIRKTLQALSEHDALVEKIERLKEEVAQEQKIYDEMLPHYKRFAEQYLRTSEETDKEYQEEYDKLLKKKNQLKLLVEQSVGFKKGQAKTQKEAAKPKLMDKLANISQP